MKCFVICLTFVNAKIRLHQFIIMYPKFLLVNLDIVIIFLMGAFGKPFYSSLIIIHTTSDYQSPLTIFPFALVFLLWNPSCLPFPANPLQYFSISFSTFCSQKLLIYTSRIHTSNLPVLQICKPTFHHHVNVLLLRTIFCTCTISYWRVEVQWGLVTPPPLAYVTQPAVEEFLGLAAFRRSVKRKFEKLQ